MSDRADRTMEVIDLTRQVKKQEYTRHPFTNRKLRVLDSFAPADGVSCSACLGVDIEKVQVVESENPDGKPYHVVWCRSCNQQKWFIISEQ